MRDVRWAGRRYKMGWEMSDVKWEEMSKGLGDVRWEMSKGLGDVRWEEMSDGLGDARWEMSDGLGGDAIWEEMSKKIVKRCHVS